MVDIRDRKRTANMNGDRYEHMLKRRFKAWGERMFPRAGSTKLIMVRDFKGLLRRLRNLKADENAGLNTLSQHPMLPPDLNAIESIWDLLQDRLLLTAPMEMESRADFIKRSRRIVTWMNTNARAHMRGLCRRQINEGPMSSS